MLVIENMVKNIKNHTVIDQLSLVVEKGQIYGIVGAHGSGKTTIMRIIAGVLIPDSGRVKVEGIDISLEPREVKRKIGYMPEAFGSYEKLTVDEYMTFYSEVYGIHRTESINISDQLLELVGLLNKKEVFVSTLAPSMKKWLCLARSLIHDPTLMILDEPASGLENDEWIEMKEMLKTLREMGKTVLISSNKLPEIADICTTIGIIEHGKIGMFGTHSEIMRNAKKIHL